MADKPPTRRTPAYGVDLSGDARDRLVPKHRTPELAVPHEVPHESTGVHVRQRVDSISTSIDQLKLDQLRQNNEIGEMRTDVVVLSTKVTGLDDKLDIVTDLVRNRARIETETTVADVHLTKVRQTTALEDQAGRSKFHRTIIGTIIAALGALAGAAAHYLAGGG